MIAVPELHEILEGSPLVVRGTMVEVEVRGIDMIGRLRVEEVIRGAPPASGVVRAVAPPPHHELRVEAWKAPLPCILALEAPGDPGTPFRTFFGRLPLDVDGDERIAAVRLTTALVDARERAPRAEALRGLLARGAFSRRAALAAVAGLERARAALDPESAPTLLALLEDPDPAIRRDAIRAHGAIEGAEPPVAALLARLDDASAGVRHAAIDRLAPLAEGARMGFDPGGHPDRRAIAIERWHRWWEKRRAEEGATR